MPAGNVSNFRADALGVAAMTDGLSRSLVGRTSTASAQPLGNRQLNYAIHVAAVTQLRYPGEGQDCHQRKRVEGKTSKEATNARSRTRSTAH
jgi:hypothetical protein